MIDSTNKGIIDINTSVDVDILAGLLGISVPMVYAGRKDGKLPANTNATYKECIQAYTGFYKTKVSNKAGSVYEAKLEQDIRNGRAKEEMQWLEIKQKKEELQDIVELSVLIQPIFMIVKANLLNIARKFPETEKDIDRTLESWYQLGEKIVEKAKADGADYVREQLDKEVDLPEAESEAMNRFGLDNG